MRPRKKTSKSDDETLATQGRYDRQAGLFDLMEAPVEWVAFRSLRNRLWSEVRGPRLLEIGVGTGKNLAYHPQRARSVAIDLIPGMLRRASRKARRTGRDADLILADAQHLPFQDDVFDAAAATFVFCSIPNPVAGLEEVRRVVRDKGRIHLLEHVRAANSIIGRIMDLLNPIAVRLSGANINRDTVSNVANADINIDSVESHGFGIIKLVRGSISRTTSREIASDIGVRESV